MGQIRPSTARWLRRLQLQRLGCSACGKSRCACWSRQQSILSWNNRGRNGILHRVLGLLPQDLELKGGKYSKTTNGVWICQKIGNHHLLVCRKQQSSFKTLSAVRYININKC